MFQITADEDFLAWEPVYRGIQLHAALVDDPARPAIRHRTDPTADNHRCRNRSDHPCHRVLRQQISVRNECSRANGVDCAHWDKMQRNNRQGQKYRCGRELTWRVAPPRKQQRYHAEGDAQQDRGEDVAGYPDDFGVVTQRGHAKVMHAGNDRYRAWRRPQQCLSCHR